MVGLPLAGLKPGTLWGQGCAGERLNGWPPACGLETTVLVDLYPSGTIRLNGWPPACGLETDLSMKLLEH